MSWNWGKIAQVVIPITSVTAMWLVNGVSAESRFYGAIVGLVAQPFWFYITYKAKQWGVFISCFFFAGAWIYGIVNYVTS
jgi:hypothetical protein